MIISLIISALMSYNIFVSSYIAWILKLTLKRASVMSDFFFSLKLIVITQAQVAAVPLNLSAPGLSN